MKKTLGMLAFVLLSVSALAQSTASADAFLTRLAGNWQGEGMAFGMRAKVISKWEWTLGQKFLRLDLQYEMQSKDGKTQTFAGHAYYQAAGQGKYEGHWFDSQGNSYPINATLDGDALTALWGLPGKSEGKSVYRLSGADKRFEIQDASKQKDGSWREFSSFKLERK